MVKRNPPLRVRCGHGPTFLASNGFTPLSGGNSESWSKRGKTSWRWKPYWFLCQPPSLALPLSKEVQGWSWTRTNKTQQKMTTGYSLFPSCLFVCPMVYFSLTFLLNCAKSTTLCTRLQIDTFNYFAYLTSPCHLAFWVWNFTKYELNDNHF